MARVLPLGCRCRVYSLGNITAADINAAAAASSVTITLSGSGLPTGYVIGGVWINMKTAFVSGTADIIQKSFPFISTNSPVEIVTESTANNTGLLQTIGIYYVNTIANSGLSKDNYANGIDLSFQFSGGVSNPKDYSAGDAEILVELLKSPV